MAVNDNAKYAYNYLIQRYQLEPFQAAGVVGNLMQESGLKTSALNPGDGNDGSDSIGIAQWNGDRAVGLHEFAERQKRPVGDLNLQLDYVMHEMTNGAESRAYKQLLASDDIAGATQAFIGFERPQGWTSDNPTGGHGYDNRLNYAAQIAGLSPEDLANATPRNSGMAYTNSEAPADLPAGLLAFDDAIAPELLGIGKRQLSDDLLQLAAQAAQRPAPREEEPPLGAPPIELAQAEIQANRATDASPVLKPWEKDWGQNAIATEEASPTGLKPWEKDWGQTHTEQPEQPVSNGIKPWEKDWPASPAFSAPAAPLDAVGEAEQRRDLRYSGGIYGDGDGLLAGIGKFLGASADGVGSGLLLGWDDEALAGATTAGGLLGDYEGARDQFDADKQVRRDQNPVASFIGEIGGGLATGMGVGGPRIAAQALHKVPISGLGISASGLKHPFLRAGGAVLEGAGYGAIAGAGEANDDRLSGAQWGAPLGAAGGLIGAGVGKGIDTLAAKRRQPPIVVSDELAEQSQVLYRKAEEANVVLKAPAFDRVSKNMILQAGRLNKELRPNTVGIVKEIQSMQGQPLSLSELDEFRQTLTLSMKGAQAQDVRTLERMKNALDDFIDGVKPRDVTGDIKGFEHVKDARALWHRKAKTEQLELIKDRAENAATGYEKGLLGELRKVANNPKRLRVFSEEEQAMIKEVVRRNNSRGIMSAFGMLSPDSTFGGMVAGGLAVGSGGTSALASAAIGKGSKAAATALTRAKMESLQRAVSNGMVPKEALTGNYSPFIAAGATGANSAKSILFGR